MFKMIRCGKGFDPVIMVTPHNAQPGMPRAKYYRFESTRWVGGKPPKVFCEIDADTAMSYFSGHADGMGFEIPPERTFKTLEEAAQFIQEQTRKEEARVGEENASVGEQLLAALGAVPEGD
ncbi:MAG: hypothetical protein AAB922_01520 [Patescibacteria group bacterium]